MVQHHSVYRVWVDLMADFPYSPSAERLGTLSLVLLLLTVALLQSASVQATEGGPAQPAAGPSTSTPQHWLSSRRCSWQVPHCQLCYIINAANQHGNSPASPTHLNRRVYICTACQPGYTLDGATDLSAHPPLVPSCIPTGPGESGDVVDVILLNLTDPCPATSAD